MATIGMLPLDFVDINTFSYTEKLELQQGNGGTYVVQLVKYQSAQLAAPVGGPFSFYSQGQTVTFPTRYVPVAGTVVQIVFPRALSIAPTPANQDTTITASIVDSRDASVYQFTLTVSQVDKIVSEGVKLLVTESGVTKTYSVDHFVRRKSSAPGA